MGGFNREAYVSWLKIQKEKAVSDEERARFDWLIAAALKPVNVAEVLFPGDKVPRRDPNESEVQR